MKVSELIEALSAYDGDLEVMLSNDAEGNSFSKLDSAFTEGFYEPLDQILYTEDDEEELPENFSITTLVLWPE